MTLPHPRTLDAAHVSPAAQAHARRLLEPGERRLYLGESPSPDARRANLLLGVVLLLAAALTWKVMGFPFRLPLDGRSAADVSRTPPALALAIGAFLLIFLSIPLAAAIGFFRRARRTLGRAVMLTDRRLVIFDVEDDPRAELHVESIPLADMRSSTVKPGGARGERWTVNAHWPNSETSETTARTFRVRAGAQDAAARLDALLAARAPQRKED